jgi:hypothetical protein
MQPHLQSHTAGVRPGHARLGLQCLPRRLCNFATRRAPNQILNTYFLRDHTVLVFESLENSRARQRGRVGYCRLPLVKGDFCQPRHFADVESGGLK